MKKLINRLLHIIYPTKCIFCGEIIPSTEFRVCHSCIESIPYNKKYCRMCGSKLDTIYGDTICYSCKNKRNPYRRIYVPLLYKDDVRQSIISFKYRRKPSYAKTFAILIFSHLKECGYFPDAITYVPIHFIRKSGRGYNQSELVAKELARLFGVPCIKMLRKTRYTVKLAKLDAKKRSETVKNTYKPVGNHSVSGKEILLVDDIVTTTSTITECCKTIKKAFDCSLSVAAIASTPKLKKG